MLSTNDTKTHSAFPVPVEIFRVKIEENTILAAHQKVQKEKEKANQHWIDQIGIWVIKNFDQQHNNNIDFSNKRYDNSNQKL